MTGELPNFNLIYLDRRMSGCNLSRRNSVELAAVFITVGGRGAVRRGRNGRSIRRHCIIYANSQ